MLASFWASSFLFAQQDSSKLQMVPVKTFPVNATVLGLLDGSKTLAVLRIEKVDPNPYQLKEGSEILADFYFTTQPMKGEKKLKGLKAQDFISVRLTAEHNRSTGQYDFTAFEYVVAAKEEEAVNQPAE